MPLSPATAPCWPLENSAASASSACATTSDAKSTAPFIGKAARLLERIDVAQRFAPGDDLLLGFLGGHAVDLADLLHQQLALAGDAVEVDARQPAPARARVQLVFVPVARDVVPLHGCARVPRLAL